MSIQPNLITAKGAKDADEEEINFLNSRAVFWWMRGPESALLLFTGDHPSSLE
jgi:hypothetical protein